MAPANWHGWGESSNESSRMEKSTVSDTPLTAEAPMTLDRALHLLRNPWGYGEHELRKARLWAADALEEASKLAAVVRDAQRYRWLRAQKHADIAACWFLPPDGIAPETPEEIDAAIDAARSR